MDMKCPPSDHARMTEQPLTLRLARPDDAPAVRRLAQLDSSRPPTGRVLLAVVGSDPVAALGVDTGSVVADPFRPTAGVVATLRQAAA
jgi:hypothetical protein